MNTKSEKKFVSTSLSWFLVNESDDFLTIAPVELAQLLDIKVKVALI